MQATPDWPGAIRAPTPQQDHQPQGLLGHNAMMVVTLQNHSGIPTVLQVSRTETATHIVNLGVRGGGGSTCLRMCSAPTLSSGKLRYT